ncbi:MAG: hypothetical protein RL653_1665 [Pseudomonadota bacterium]|jgi:hypothetical protein
MILSLLVAASLGQAATPASPPSTPDNAERAAVAAEKAAVAAERVAKAVEKLAGIEPAPAAGAEAAADQSNSAWRGSVGLGLTWLSGNADSLTATALLGLERRWANWAVAGKASGAYGQARPANDLNAPGQVVALRAAGSLRGDRRFAERMSAFVQAGAETDHVRSVELRYSGEAGASSTWVDIKEKTHQVAFVRTDLALRYTNEQRFQYYPTPANLPDILLIGPRVALSAMYGLSKDTFLSQDVDATPNIVGDARVLVNSTTKLSTRLSQSVLLTTSFQVAYDSQPAAGKRPLDTILTAGLELGL